MLRRFLAHGKPFGRWLLIPSLFAAAVLLLPVPQEDSFTGVERVVAVGDVHGDHDTFAALLRSAGLVDEQLKWTGGKAHLVQTGDVLDRGPDSRKAMDLLMRLEEEAAKAGGKVHALIGNHEAMILTGDYTYLSAGEIASFRDADSEKTREAAWLEHAKLAAAEGVTTDDAYRKRWEAGTPLGFTELRQAFGPQGKYGKWIRGHNAIVKIDGSLFLHGGISPAFAGWTVRKINEAVRAELADFAKLDRGVIQRDDGPLWYRGLGMLDDGALDAHVRAVLASYQVERVVIGHTIAHGAIQSRLGGRILMIDVALSRFYGPQDRVACLVIEKGAPSALHRGQRVALPSDSDEDQLRYRTRIAEIDRAARSAQPSDK